MNTNPQIGFHVSSPQPVILARGKDALDLLNRLSTNDLRRLAQNESTQTILVNEKGRMVDILTIFFEMDSFWLVASPQNAGAVREWLEKFVFLEDVRFEFTAQDYARVQLAQFGLPPEYGVGESPEESFQRRINKLKELLRGFREIKTQFESQQAYHAEVITPAGEIEGLTQQLRSIGIAPLTDEDYEDQRTLLGIPRFGKEISDEFNPLEAGLGHLVSESKGCYIGQEVLARLNTYDKVQRRLAKLFVSQRLEPLPYTIFGGDRPAVIITSVSRLKSGAGWHALGFVHKSHLFPNAVIQTPNSLSITVHGIASA